jgi:phosphoribosylformylglycinamidine cyclo-ligase
VLATLAKVEVKGMAHITGGGLTENVPRVLPAALAASLETSRWTRPDVFRWLQKIGNIEDAEMHRTFNCGIGMTICVAAEHVETTLACLKSQGETPIVIGEVRRGSAGVVVHG